MRTSRQVEQEIRASNYGDTGIVIGSETVVPTPDAARPDAGKTVHRRFTEVWLRRDGKWQKVVRHVSNVLQTAP